MSRSVDMMEDADRFWTKLSLLPAPGLCRFDRKSSTVGLLKFCKKVRAGVDVMIIIFCNFCQFSAKKLALFSKTNVMNKIWHILALSKTPIFSGKIFLKS
jgi:hypothetical protein